MKTKRLIFSNTRDSDSGVIGITGQVYDFGVKQNGFKGGDACTVIFEQTSDGGATWTNLATFTMDDNTEVTAKSVYVSGGAMRARAATISGSPLWSVWMSEVNQ